MKMQFLLWERHLAAIEPLLEAASTKISEAQPRRGQAKILIERVGSHQSISMAQAMETPPPPQSVASPSVLARFCMA